MNNKGFTLIEVLAVIAILAILTIMITPAIINIRNNTLQRTYTSRLSMINNAALDWASDNLVQIPSQVSNTYNANSNNTCDSNCACILVGELINRGYLSGSDNNRQVMTNPINNEVLNDKLVCVRYNNNDVLNRKLVSYMVN
jgi:prepilin-type N-terminal cleavage/methylation domain-containing protein